MKSTSLFNKGLKFAAGVIGLQGFSYFYDYIVYPIGILWFGVIKGTIILFVVVVFLNYLCILIYDRIKIDLFGFEELKKVKEESKTSQNKTLFQKMLLWGEVPAFIALSWYDPIFAVIYKRKSRNFEGFTKRDYGILILSTFIGCVLWSAIWGPIGFVIKRIWFRFF